MLGTKARLHHNSTFEVNYSFELKIGSSCVDSIGHLYDGVILLPRQECFVRMLSYSNLSSHLGIKRRLEN